MSGLALVARALGARVTGSDRAESSYSARLRAAGIEPAIGHDAANVPDGRRGGRLHRDPGGQPGAGGRPRGRRAVLHRGELLGEVSRLKRTIAVAGTHGKTTTASMAAHVLLEAGRDPAYLIGGELRSAGTNAAWGEGEWVVVEADESDRSFLELGARRGGGHQRRARPPRDLRARSASWSEAFAEFAEPVPSCASLGPGRGRSTAPAPRATGSTRAICAPRAGAARRRLALRGRGRAGAS